LFSAAFTLAFHAMLRIGELAQTGNKQSGHSLNIEDINIEQNCLLLLLKTSKTDQFGLDKKLCISALDNKVVCPVQTMYIYLQDRSKLHGQLFCHFYGTPLTRFQFSAILKKALNVLGVKNANCKSHSFRIGMATTYAKVGVPYKNINKK
jgi:site-specific recombinase XerD